MIFENAGLPGVATVHHQPFRDIRGDFVKIFSAPIFQSDNHPHSVAEIFWSSSNQGVIRGMHFQHDNAPQSKIITVVAGEILDVLLDVRPESESYGKAISVLLKGGTGLSLLIPHGVAHGFQVLSESAITLYAVSTGYSEENDLGVRFDSFGFAWPIESPIVSARDAALPRFNP